jgi:formylmethanofuran--tetrahydromethanopterin N-formyltransferase
VKLNGALIEDTFAEAFGMRGTRLIVTADTERWAKIAGTTMTGFATSVIGCGIEAGIEAELGPDQTPDGRPGVSILLFGFNYDALVVAVRNRVGQCILTCPGTACFSGFEGGQPIPLGRALRYFGDGYQAAKRMGDRRFWRIPVMDGEFLVEDRVGEGEAIGGGNFLILAKTRKQALEAAERAIVEMTKVRDVIMPFPGGIVRSGSKVGSKYKALGASTNHFYCPTLKGAVKSDLSEEVGAVYEIVIDGFTAEAISHATAVGVRAACGTSGDTGVLAISAGNYGGNLGQFHFHLHKLLK